ncbi:Flagellar protein FlhE OS=Castellaniella defragrans OX=75697 GN=HNR28_002852 PE=4 SV=1 [Castellaniella denitrificans]|uniref:flagellar protein FlhE n=1 Tax=Castellaniella denitrificans TaxID=56119 RepID=UPI003606B4E7
MRIAGRIPRGAAVAGAALILAAGAARAGDRAWTRDRVSQGLQAQGRAVAVLYEPGARDPAVPASARITRVYASRDYDSAARISTRLCWGSERGPCVPLEGRSVETDAFDGRAARGPLLLVHRVEGWGGDHPPVFVRGTVTVWFDGR